MKIPTPDEAYEKTVARASTPAAEALRNIVEEIDEKWHNQSELEITLKNPVSNPTAKTMILSELLKAKWMGSFKHGSHSLISLRRHEVKDSYDCRDNRGGGWNRDYWNRD